jgi:3-oxoacyl-[acyl-carrier protein] reductase
MKTVLITGTSRGLGKTMAEYFIENKWSVIGLSRSKSAIKSNQYKHYKVDIKDSIAVKAVFDKLPNIDILINNSAVFELKAFESTTIESINDIIDTNIKGTMYITKFALDRLVIGGKIIFINSVAGLNELKKQSIYCASKHAIKAFAGVLAQELRQRSISVSNIHPGGINTTLWHKDNPYPAGPVQQAMQPEFIAKLVYFIADSSNEIDYKTVTLFPSIEWH